MSFPTLGYFPVAAGATNYHGTGIPNRWSPTVLEKLWGRLFLPNISSTEYEGQISGFGANLTIRLEEDISTFSYTDGQAISYQNPEIPTTTLVIDKGRGWGFRMPRVSKQQMDIDFTPTWTTNAAKNVKVEVEKQVLAAIPAECSTYTSGLTAGVNGDISLGETGTPISLTKTTIVDKVAELRTILSQQNVDPEMTYLILPPEGVQRIVTSEFKDASLTGDNTTPMRNGWRGKLFNFDIYESNYLSTASDGGATCYNCLFGWKRATAFAGTISENDVMQHPSYFGDFYRGLFIYGFKVVRPYAVGNLYCKFTNDAS